MSLLLISSLTGWIVLGFSRSVLSSGRAVPFELILVSVVCVSWTERRRLQLGLFAPWTSFSAAYAVMFGIVPLADLMFKNPIVDSSRWTFVAWMSVGVYLLTYGGYRAGQKVYGRRARTQARWNAWAAGVISSVLLVAAIGAVVISVVDVGGLSQYVAHFANRRSLLPQSSAILALVTLATPAVLLGAGSFVARPTSGRGAALLVVWLPPALVVSGYWGQRWRDLALIIALLAVFHLGVRKISRLAILAVVGVLVALFVSVALARNVLGTGKGIRSISGDNLYYNYLASNEVGQFRAFVITVGGVPRTLPYQHGKTFLSVIPGNAYPTGGSVFTATFYPRLAEHGVTYANSLPGELFLNFGWWGVGGGMFLFGLILGLLERYERERGRRIGPLLVYSYLIVPAAGLLRGDFTTFFGYPAVAVLSLLIGCWLTERRGPPSEKSGVASEASPQAAAPS